MPNTLREAVIDAKETLQEQITEEDLTEEQAQERIHEIADNHVPIYYADVLDIASNNITIALEIPDMWPAFGIATPMNLMMGNIYEHICKSLYEVLEGYEFDEEE